MRSALFLLISSSFLIALTNAAAGYTDKNGNPAPNPCNNGENVYFDTLIFNCIDGKKVYYGCKVGDAEVKQDTVKDENNLRTQYCHKEGNSVKTTVTGCVTDDNQFIDESKTVKQADGTDFTCTKNSNGFSYLKKSPPTKVSDCSAGQTKVVGSRYLLQCYEESSGYFTYKLAACYATLDDEESRVEVTKTHDDYVSTDKQLGFRYSCYAQGNNYFYEPVGCLLGSQLVLPGNVFQNGSLTVMCMRDGPQRLRLRPVYSSGSGTEKSCTEAKTYIEGNFKYECVPGQQPKPIACIFFKDKKEIPIGSTFNDDKAYQYKCEQTSDNKHLALVKVACLDDENQILVEGGKKTLSDGSRIECQSSVDDGLLRVIVAGKPPIKQCNEGEKFVRDYLQYQCQSQGFKPFACAPLNNETLIIEIGKTYDTDNYQYKCEQQGKTVIYHAIACLDADKKVLMPGEKRLIKIFTYECQRKANNDLALVISNEKGCKHPTLQGKLVRPNDIIELPKTINKLDYKTLFQCVADGDKGYYLIDIGCKVDGKKYDIDNFVSHDQDVYKCVRPNAGGVHLIYIPIDQLSCRYGGKIYKSGEEFKSADGISHYQCLYGVIVKTGCFVHDKRIPANQVMYCNDEPYYCPGNGEGVIPIPIRGCFLKNGKIIKIGETFDEKSITYACTYTKYDHIYKPVIVPVGCIYNGKLIPLNSYIFYQNQNIVCEVDNSFTVIVHPATPDQELCISKTSTYNCQGNGNGNGGQVTTAPSDGGPDHTATPGNGNVDHGQGSGSTQPGSATGSGNEFPDDDGNKATTPHGPNSPDDDDDCDDTTTPDGPGNGDVTAIGQPGDGVTGGVNQGTTKKYGENDNENPFPTDSDGNPIRDHTATGNHGGHNTNRPGEGTTRGLDGNNNENPFPTDENGNPITPSGPHDHTATGSHDGHSPGQPGEGTTKGSDGHNNENTLPTDENGNPITPSGPQDHTATDNHGSNHPHGPGEGTTKSSGGHNDDHDFPTDKDGNPITPAFPGDHTATGGHDGHSPSGPGEGTTKRSTGHDSENPLPTDENGNPVTPLPGHTATGDGNENPNGPGGTTKKGPGNDDGHSLPTDKDGNPVTPLGDYTATGQPGGHTPDGENGGTTIQGGGHNDDNEFPTDDQGNPITPKGHNHGSTPDKNDGGSTRNPHDQHSGPTGEPTIWTPRPTPSSPDDGYTGHYGSHPTRHPNDGNTENPNGPNTGQPGDQTGATPPNPNNPDGNTPKDGHASSQTPRNPDGNNPDGSTPKNPNNPENPGDHTNPGNNPTPKGPGENGNSSPGPYDHPGNPGDHTNPGDNPDSTPRNPGGPGDHSNPGSNGENTTPKGGNGNSSPGPNDGVTPKGPDGNNPDSTPRNPNNPGGPDDHSNPDHNGGNSTPKGPGENGNSSPGPNDGTPKGPGEDGSGSTPRNSNHPEGPGDHSYPSGTPNTPDGNEPHTTRGDGSNTPDGPGNGGSTNKPGEHETPGGPSDGSTLGPGQTPKNPGENDGNSTPRGPGDNDHSGGTPKNPNDNNGGSTPGGPDHPTHKQGEDEPTTRSPGEHGGSSTPKGPGDDQPQTGRTPPNPDDGNTPQNPNDPHNPGQGTTQPPHVTLPPQPPQKCKDLLPKDICQLLQPLCLQHSFRVAAATLPSKDDREAVLSQIENSKASPNMLPLEGLVKKGAYPEEALKKTKIAPVSFKRTLPEITSTVKTNCFALQEQCQSNSDSLACTNYISHCSKDLNQSICKVTTTCTTTKEIYKTVTGEIISKLCPETCLVQECYNNHSKPGNLDLSNLLAPELLTCLLA